MSDERIAKLEARVEELERILAALRGVFTGTTADAATDRELDGPYGDPEVKVQPRDWHGEPMKGRKFSRCPAEFLDLLAETLDYFEKKNRESGARTSNGKLKADFDKRQARLCRGWARRIRSGWQPPAVPRLGAGEGLGSGATSNPFASSTGFGAPRRPAPAPPVDVPMADDDFPFGANAKAPPSDLEDEEDMPL